MARSRSVGSLVTVALAFAVATAGGDWSDRLYRDYSPAAASEREFHLVLIPYYAWDNRGK